MKSRGSICVAVLFAAAALAAQNAPPQKPDPQRPVFRAGTDVVRVDVIPRRNGKVVEGLNSEDFQVTEDGVAQTIDTFEYIKIAGPESGEEPLDPQNASQARKMAVDPRNRIFVFYLDIYNINREGAYRAREPLLHFLRFGMGPRDLFAVMTPHESPEYLEFTRATHSLGAVMSATRQWGLLDSPELEKDEYFLEGCSPGGGQRPGFLVRMKREIEVVSDLWDLVTHLGALRPERKNIIVISERWQPWWSSVGRPRAPLPGPAPLGPVFDQRDQRDQGGRGSFVPPPTMFNDPKCNSARNYLMGFDLERRKRDLSTHARRHNVAFYFIPPAPADLFNFSDAGVIASETDGMSIVSNDMGLNLQRVMDHQTGFYMLGYRSTAGQAGKKARTVRVRTSKAGVDLDVRRIYDPPPQAFIDALNNPRAPVEPTEVQRALEYLSGIRDDREIYVYTVAGTDHVDVTVELGPRLAARDPWRSGADVEVTLVNDADKEIASGITSYVSGQRSVQLRVPVQDRPAGLRARVRVSKGPVGIADVTPVEAPYPGPIGPPALFRAGSLPRAPFLPAADPRFSRTERVRIEWPLAGPATDPVVRLLNATSDARQADIVVTPADAAAPVLRAELRLAALAPGDYVVEVTAKVDGKPAARYVPIRVTR